jgi:hypothetical protein
LRLDFALILYVSRKSVKRALSVELLISRAPAWLTRRGNMSGVSRHKAHDLLRKIRGTFDQDLRSGR